MSQSILLSFSCMSFIVSSLTFRSLVHFEFIFVFGVRKCSNFILFHVAAQFSQYHLLRRLSSPLYILKNLCHRLTDHNYVGLLLGSLVCSLDLCVCFRASAILVTAALQYSLKSGMTIPPAFFKKTFYFVLGYSRLTML